MWYAWPPGGDPNLRKQPRRRKRRWSVEQALRRLIFLDPNPRDNECAFNHSCGLLQVKPVDPYPIKALGLFA